MRGRREKVEAYNLSGKRKREKMRKEEMENGNWSLVWVEGGGGDHA